MTLFIEKGQDPLHVLLEERGRLRRRAEAAERQLQAARAALDNSQSLLVAMLLEQRPRAEIEQQVIENRTALAQLEEGGA